MTSESEIFVTDVLENLVKKELKKAGLYGKDDIIEIKCPDDWCDIWDASEFPTDGEAKILDIDEEEVGRVCWKTNFFINDEVMGNYLYIDAEPIITRLEYKGKTVIDRTKNKIYFSIGKNGKIFRRIEANSLEEAKKMINPKNEYTVIEIDDDDFEYIKRFFGWNH